MSRLRGIDRAHDIDLGPSNGTHSRTGVPGGTVVRPDPSSKHQRSDRAEYQRVYQARKRMERAANRCGFLMPTYGDLCARPMGHGSGHRSVLAPDHRLSDKAIR